VTANLLLKTTWNASMAACKARTCRTATARRLCKPFANTTRIKSCRRLTNSDSTASHRRKARAQICKSQIALLRCFGRHVCTRLTMHASLIPLGYRDDDKEKPYLVFWKQELKEVD